MSRFMRQTGWILLVAASPLALSSATAERGTDDFASSCTATKHESSGTPTLANGPGQSCAELHSLALYRAAAVQRATKRLRAALRADPRVATAGQADRAMLAAQQIAFGEIERLIGETLVDPFAYWFYKPGHRLGGQQVPGGKFAASNPDTVFRFTPLDPKGRYELRGRFHPRTRASYFSLHFKGRRGADGQEKDIAVLFDTDIRTDTDGGFVISIGPGPADGSANHVALAPDMTGLLIRDTLKDWASELPTRLSLRRIDAGRSAPLSDVALIEKAVRNIDHAARTVPGFREALFFRTAANILPQPGAHVSGGWARTVSANFSLKAGEALVFTLDPGGARYLGVQTADMLTGAIAPESRTSALNDSQVQHDDDGTVTYVLAPADPGTGNWIDTGGVRQGLIMIRWQGLPEDAHEGPAVRSALVVPTARAQEIAAERGLRPDPAARAARHALYMRRYSGW